MDIKLNPLNNGQCPPPEQQFVEAFGQQIATTSQDKDLIFLGDGYHVTNRVYGYVFSRPVLAGLQQAGIKHLFIEALSLDYQIFIDAVADSRLTPEQFSRTLYPLMRQAPIPIDIFRANTDFIGQGIQLATDLGIKVHALDGREGILKSEDLKTYTYYEKLRHGQWLQYLLANPDYFNNPEQFLETIIKRLGNAKKFRLAESAILARTGGTATEEIIHDIWLTENKPPKTKYRFNYNLDDPRLIDRRTEGDKLVMERANGIRKGEKAAIVYGAGHIGNKGGGFLKHIEPGTEAVFILFPSAEIAQDLKALNTIGYVAAPDHIMVALAYLKIFRVGSPEAPLVSIPHDSSRYKHG